MDRPAAALVCLIVLDGWGVAPPDPGNAIALARTPNYDCLLERYPHAEIRASGEAVGLPEGQMGNSEVGHLNLGAGRVVYQDLTRINHSIDDDSFFSNPVLLAAFEHARNRGGAVHLMGLLSGGGVHSDIGHLEALLEIARRQGASDLFLHLFLDGRDVPPKSAPVYLESLEASIKRAGVGEIATISGRYYAMDRDHRWERTRLAYDAIVHGRGPGEADPQRLIEDSYAAGVTDEFVIPAAVSEKPGARVQTADSVIFFNFRPDRARQLIRALISEEFTGFDRGEDPPLPYLVCMTEYDATFDCPIAYPPEELKNILAEVLSQAEKTQLHIAETEKYAHVTFFFNGGREEAYAGETRELIPSPADVATYDLKPAMSAREVADALDRQLTGHSFDFVIVNFANCDMVGHTGNLAATIAAVEVVDECVGRVVDRVTELGGVCLITSDHGNAEVMIDGNGGPSTAHSTGLVPLIVTAPVSLASGCALGDIAPAILELLGLSIPAEMSKRRLIDPGS